MSGLPPGSVAALAPVEHALLAAAAQEAEGIRTDTRVEAAGLVDAARQEADRIRRAAAAEGEAAARSEAILRSARVRREAHETVLARRNDLRLELGRSVLESAAALRTDPRYPQLLARLSERGRALLGPDATLTESPDGGILAEAGSRRLDLSLPVLAAGTLASMTPEVSALWTL